MTIDWRSRILLAGALLLTVSACRGTSGGSVVPGTPAQSSTAHQAAAPAMLAETSKPLTPVTLSPGAVVGTDDAFAPHDGDMPSGGRGKPVDAIPCRPTEYVDQYHIHFYVGIVVNGVQIAVPDAIGMHDPAPETNGFIEDARCYYYIHTHDASGTIHVEVPRNVAYGTSMYNFAKFLDVWGVSRSAKAFGPFHGSVHVFVGNVPLKQVVVSKYALWKKSMNDIALYSHEAIWIVVGKVPAKLPPVTFYTEY